MMPTDNAPDDATEPALIIGERRYPRSKLKALLGFLDAAAVPGSPEEAHLQKVFADGVASGVPVFNRIPGPVTAEELSSLSPEDRARIGLPETGTLDPSMLRRGGVTGEPTLVIIDPLMHHLAAEDGPGEPS